MAAPPPPTTAPSLPPPRILPPYNHRKVTAACLACRRRKSKCNGGPPPCRLCTELNTECVIDATSDRRRKVDKRVADELDLHQPILDSLFDSLRSAGPERLENIISLVRNNEPTSQILTEIRKSDSDTSRDGEREGSHSRPPQSSGENTRGRKRSFHETIQAEQSTRADLAEASSTTTSDKSNGQNNAELESSAILAQLLQAEEDTAIRMVLQLRDHVGREVRDGESSLQQHNYDPDYIQQMQAKLLLNQLSNPDPSRLAQVANVTKSSVTSPPPEYESSDMARIVEERKSWHPVLQPQGYTIYAPTLAYDGPSTESETVEDDWHTTGRKENVQNILEVLTSSAGSGPINSSTRPSPSRSASQPENLSSWGTRGKERSTWWPSPGYVGTFGNLPMSSALITNGYPIPIQARQLSIFRAPEHLILPLNTHENSFLSKTLTSFREAGLRMLSNGVPVNEVFGPEEVNVDLVFRDRRPEDAHSVCNFAAALTRNLDRVEMPLKLIATVWVAFYYRWLLLPTAHNYTALPPWFRPTRRQRLLPHCPSLDIVTSPHLRDALCVEFRDFMTPLEGGQSMNWPHELERCVRRDHETGQIFLADEFRSHCDNPANITLTSDIFVTFPELRGKIEYINDKPIQGWKKG